MWPYLEIRKRAIKRWWFYDIPLMIYNLLIVCFWGWDRVMSFLEASVCVIQLIQWGLPDTHEIKGGRQTAVSQQERWIVQWITSKGMRMSWVIIIKAQLGLLDLYLKKDSVSWRGVPFADVDERKDNMLQLKESSPSGLPTEREWSFPVQQASVSKAETKEPKDCPTSL